MNSEVLSEEEFKTAVRGLAGRLRERAFTYSGRWPRESVQEIARLGFYAVSLPEEHGGGGLSHRYAAHLVGELATVCPDTANAVRFTNFGPANFLARRASEAVRERYLPGVAAGNDVIALAVSEPGAGTNWDEITTTVRVEGDQVVIDGGKIYCSEGDSAVAYVIIAKFPDGQVGSVVVDRDAPGLTISGSDTNMYGGVQSHLQFVDCSVPASYVLSDEGLAEQVASYNFARIGSALLSVGAAQMALDLAIDHLHSRRQYGEMLSERQGLQWMAADSQLAIDAARVLCMEAIRVIESGAPADRACAQAKLASGRAAAKAVDDSVQMFGAAGYMQGSQVEYLYRLVRGYRISGGSEQFLQNTIWRDLSDRSVRRVTA